MVQFYGLLDEMPVQLRAFNFKRFRGYGKISDLKDSSTTDYFHYEYVRPVLLSLKNSQSDTNSSFGLIGDLVFSTSKSEISIVSKKHVSSNNVEIVTIGLNSKSIRCIDGNHRLAVFENNDAIVPFTLILWESSIRLSENEAYLYNLLNSNRKNLNFEELLSIYEKNRFCSFDDLVKFDIYLPHLLIAKQISQNYHSKFEAELSIYNQIKSILYTIQDTSLSVEHFSDILTQSLEYYLNESKIDFIKNNYSTISLQLIFYFHYLHLPQKSIIQLNNWLKKKNYPSSIIFNNVKQIYNEYLTDHTNKELKVFVAMPFWNNNLTIVIKFNKIYNNALNAIIGDDNTHLKLKLIPIMLRKGSSERIDLQILKEIKEADIFIGDITKNNRNVIFEIGFAHALKKPIFLLKESSDKSKVPFDMDKLLYKPYSKDNLEESLIKTIKLNLSTIILEKFKIHLHDAESILKFIPAPNIAKWHFEVQNLISTILLNSDWDFENKKVTVPDLRGNLKEVNCIEDFEDYLLELASAEANAYANQTMISSVEITRIINQELSADLNKNKMDQLDWWFDSKCYKALLEARK